MHLLVLNAFRPEEEGQETILRIRSQCTFWCSVLSDASRPRRHVPHTVEKSQCTFWCSVLSDGETPKPHRRCLNAPSGAQCFPTRDTAHQGLGRRVSMHLLVLSAFRPSGEGYEQLYSEIPVSMHLLVLSAFRQYEGYGRIKSTSGLNAPSGAQCFPTVRRANCWQPGSWSQCTFWCSVLSDQRIRRGNVRILPGLNAPSGAQCFPTLLG